MRDAVNKAARIVINYCIENKIGTIVFGWNKGQKDSIDLGSKNNQKFVKSLMGLSMSIQVCLLNCQLRTSSFGWRSV